MAPGSPWPSMKSPEIFGKVPGQITGIVPEMVPRVFESRRGMAFGRPGGQIYFYVFIKLNKFDSKTKFRDIATKKSS